MSRRFPTPLFGIDDVERRSAVFVDLAVTTDGQLDKPAFVTRVRDQLRKPDRSDRYKETYLRRIVTTYIQLGILRHRSDGTITVWQFGHDWHGSKIDFETFCWYGVKRSWVLDGRFPEGIDGLRSLHRLLANADDPLTRSQLEAELRTTYDYGFNEEGVRGYPSLLVCLGAAERTEAGYIAGPHTDRWRDRFRNADLLSAFDRWLKQEGPSVEPPSDRVKRDLSKYYVYRESGGLGKHRRLFDTFRRDYLKSAAYEQDVSKPTIRRADAYIDAENRRRELRLQIRDRFSSIERGGLNGLSTETLDRIAEATTESEASRIISAAGTGLSRTDIERWASSDRPAYEFPDEFELYRWQRNAVAEWFSAGDGIVTANERAPETGIARVVTGAGKTVMALAIVQRWLQAHPEGRVTILVPTKVLMRQWLEELTGTLHVPPDDIGWAGGGHKDGFEDGRRILVSIVNTAVKDDYLAGTLQTAGVEDHLLIADECHRYTGDAFSTVFECPRTASLGLSATPLSDPGSDERTASDDLLLRELGDIYYDLTYDEAIEQNLIPEFRVTYVGFDLTDSERRAYTWLTDEIVDAVSDIETRYGNRLHELEGHFAHKLQVIAEATDGPTPSISDFFRYTQQRRELIADAIGRQAITLSLLKRSIDAEQKSIVFQERIEQLEQMVAPAETRGRNYRTGGLVDGGENRQALYEQYPGLEQADQALEELFFDADYRPVMYHSGHRHANWNDFAIEWFDDGGFANVMLSVKALIEGVDVPSADVGVVRVSSGSVRQRIQTLGRVLRTGEDPTATSELYVLYARDTVDENIFRDYDWGEQLSMADVSHLTWDPDGEWTRGDWDPEAPFDECVRGATAEERPTPKSDRPIPDVEDLAVGDTYVGPREGYRFSVDSDGRPFEGGPESRQYIRSEDAATVAKYVHRRNGGGTVIVNEANHALMIDQGDALFLGEVTPDEFEYADETTSVVDDVSSSTLDDLI